MVFNLIDKYSLTDSEREIMKKALNTDGFNNIIKKIGSITLVYWDDFGNEENLQINDFNSLMEALKKANLNSDSYLLVGGEKGEEINNEDIHEFLTCVLIRGVQENLRKNNKLELEYIHPENVKKFLKENYSMNLENEVYGDLVAETISATIDNEKVGGGLIQGSIFSLRGHNADIDKEFDIMNYITRAINDLGNKNEKIKENLKEIKAMFGGEKKLRWS